MEAGLALGMSRGMALRRVIVPQAIRIVIPPVTNDFIALFKDTSVCSVITIVELTKQYSILANSTGGVHRVRHGDGGPVHGDEPAAVLVLALVRAANGASGDERGCAGMIEVCDLVKRHGSLEVLRGITLSINRGEVAVIIGPSGGGKSTFLRCLNGLEPFQGGTSRSTACISPRTPRPRPGRRCSVRCGGASGWSSRASTCSHTGRSWRT